jgi:hypothetical protein
MGTTGYQYSSDVTVKYIAEYLWGLLEATSDYADAQGDYVHYRRSDYAELGL